jgi:hypothetical protein
MINTSPGGVEGFVGVDIHLAREAEVRQRPEQGTSDDDDPILP